jgi:IMP dehydrogenase
MKKDKFFDKMEQLGLALSYGDVRLKTRYSEVLPNKTKLETKFSKNVALKFPIVSSPMDTVTESKMAIEMAKLGGLGIIHRALTPRDQANEVAKVKFYLNGLIRRPITVRDNETIEAIIKRMDEKGYSFHSFPVLDAKEKLVGLLTSSNFEFCSNLKLTAKQIMSKDLIKAKQGISLKEVFQMMLKNKKKIIPLVDSKGNLAGIYVYTDVKRIISGGSPDYNLDANGNLRVGAAVGVGEEALERVKLMSKIGVDVIVIDTAHGDSKAVLETLKKIKKNYQKIDVVVGNVSEGESAKRLADAGADGIKVGQGPGSICTTRVVAGIGCPQVTAVYNCAKAVRGMNIPICADGGIEYSGDITIAIAAGAETVMLGKMFSGTLEAPGEIIMHQGTPFKKYRGMGSLGAMEKSRGSKERYGQAGNSNDKLVPEGVEGIVPYKGEISKIFFQLLGGIRSGMGYLGAFDMKELQEKGDFHRISKLGLDESHPHGITITEDAPNYKGL